MSEAANVLDDPAWNALLTGNGDMAIGNDLARVFPPDISPFAGLRAPDKACFDALYQLVAADRTIGLFLPRSVATPPNWRDVTEVVVYQLVHDGQHRAQRNTRTRLVQLNETHVAEMIALTSLTNPGPFFERTIDFGSYRGVFDDGRLVAMAGHRLQPEPYVEISAVCTHPDAQGKGYARQLLTDQAQRIIAAAKTPFLHVLTTNTVAIGLYESAGFAIRAELPIRLLRKQ